MKKFAKIFIYLDYNSLHIHGGNDNQQRGRRYKFIIHRITRLSPPQPILRLAQNIHISYRSCLDSLVSNNYHHGRARGVIQHC